MRKTLFLFVLSLGMGSVFLSLSSMDGKSDRECNEELKDRCIEELRAMKEKRKKNGQAKLTRKEEKSILFSLKKYFGVYQAEWKGNCFEFNVE